MRVRQRRAQACVVFERLARRRRLAFVLEYGHVVGKLHGEAAAGQREQHPG